MPTVIDSLVVELGFDTSRLKASRAEAETQLKNVREAAETTGKRMEASGKSAAEFFSGIKNQALALVGILTGGMGLEALIRNTTSRLAELGDQARDIGRTVPELDAFRMAIGRNGGQAEAAGQSFLRLTDMMERFKVMGQGPTNFFGPLGIQRGDDALTAVTKYFDFVKQHADDPALARLYGQGIGLDPGTINAALRITQRGGNLQEELTLSRQIGVTTKEMADHMQTLQTSFATLEQALRHVSDVMVDKVAPGLAAVVDQLAKDVAHGPPTAQEIRNVNPDATQLMEDPRKAGMKFLKWLVGDPEASVESMSGEDKQFPQTAQGDRFGKLLDKWFSKNWLSDGLTRLMPQWFPESPGWLGRAFVDALPRWLSGLFRGAADVTALSGEPTGNFIPPSGGGPSGDARTDRRGGPRVAPLTGAEQQRASSDSFAFWKRQGYSDDTAAAMAAQEMAESGGNPANRGDGGSAHGLYQWHADRRAKILAGTGIDVSTANAEDQRRAMAWEVSHSESMAFGPVTRQGSAFDAGRHATGVERPGDYLINGRENSPTANERGRLAEAIKRRELAERNRRIGPIFGPQTPTPPASALSGHELLRRDQLDPSLLPDPSSRIPLPAAGGANDNSTSLQINNLNVHTQATDANGISKSIHGALAEEMIQQSNRGLN